MKKFFLVSIFMAFFLSGCGQSAPSDQDMSAKYSISLQQYQEIKKAAESMGMPVEGHLQSLGFTAKQ